MCKKKFREVNEFLSISGYLNTLKYDFNLTRVQSHTSHTASYECICRNSTYCLGRTKPIFLCFENSSPKTIEKMITND